MQKYNIIDEASGILYCLEMTPEDGHRFETDIYFATQKLDEVKNKFAAEKNSVVSQSEMLEAAVNSEDLILETDNPGALDSPAASPTTQSDSGFMWPHNAILFLIEQYHKRESEVYSGKISQKKVWQAISKELINIGYEVTGPQCMSKFQGLKRTYKVVKDHNEKSKNCPNTWQYFDIMHELLGSKPYMQPVASVSSTGKRTRENGEKSNSKMTKLSKGNQLTTQSLLMSLQKSKADTEQNRERRHQEVIQQRSEAIAVFKQLVETLKK